MACVASFLGLNVTAPFKEEALAARINAATGPSAPGGQPADLRGGGGIGVTTRRADC